MRQCAIVACIATAALMGGPLARFAAEQAWLGESVSQWIGQGSLTAIVFAGLLALMAMQRGGVSKLLAMPVIVTLGEISFAIYLIGSLIVLYYERRVQAFADVPRVATFFMIAAITLLAAHVAWAWIERPLRRPLPNDRERETTEKGKDCSVAAADLKVPAYRNLSPATLELARRPATAMWGTLSRPGPVLLGVEAGALMILLFAWVGLAGTNVRLMTESTAADAIAKETGATYKNVRFGDAFMLLGIDSTYKPNGLHIRTVWQSLKDQPLDYIVVFHLVKERNTEPLARFTHPQDIANGQVKAGATWEDNTFIPRAKLNAEAKMLGLGLRHTLDCAYGR